MFKELGPKFKLYKTSPSSKCQIAILLSSALLYVFVCFLFYSIFCSQTFKSLVLTLDRMSDVKVGGAEGPLTGVR